MKQHWIEYHKNPKRGPMSYWVHVEQDGLPFQAACVFAPPFPSAVPGKGYPLFHVMFSDFVFVFASLDELDVCVQVLGERVLPTPLRLVNERKNPLRPGLPANRGLNNFWLGRLPSRLMSWRVRQKVVPYLRLARADFVQELTPRKSLRKS